MAYFKKEITTVVLGAHFLVAVVEGWVVNNSYISRFSVWVGQILEHTSQNNKASMGMDAFKPQSYTERAAGDFSLLKPGIWLED